MKIEKVFQTLKAALLSNVAIAWFLVLQKRAKGSLMGFKCQNVDFVGNLFVSTMLLEEAPQQRRWMRLGERLATASRLHLTS